MLNYQRICVFLLPNLSHEARPIRQGTFIFKAWRQIALGESVKKKTSTQGRWQARIDLVSSGDQLQLDKLHYIYI